ncbi:trace amine-associated receptor 13c-like [Anabas testudineus]|uniref:trace amine-associated receptor 13c-like n=1 Tax=Anabas testudineus TaxID=64144 RepID=UPI000E458166|nr:trace amine-associated receptor 13c-like [Anabas testudineus]
MSPYWVRPQDFIHITGHILSGQATGEETPGMPYPGLHTYVTTDKFHGLQEIYAGPRPGPGSQGNRDRDLRGHCLNWLEEGTTLEETEFCFPQLLNASCRKHIRPHSEAMAIYILQSSNCFLTVFLNMLVIISISHFRQLQTPTNLLLLSLAVSDFLVGVFVIPFQILLAEPCWLLGDMVCVLYDILAFLSVSASVGNMVLISVDRYVAICDPLHYPNKVNQKRIRISVLLCWIYSVFYSVMFLYDNLVQPGRYNSCQGKCVVNIIVPVDLVLSFIVPISAIIILYMRVFVVAVSQARSMRSHIAAVKLQQNITTTKSELKAARTLGVIVAVFLMCYCPYYCVSLTGRALTMASSAKVFMIFLVYFNSCLNPVIYAFFCPWFRKSIKLIVTLEILRPHSHEASIL